MPPKVPTIQQILYKRWRIQGRRAVLALPLNAPPIMYICSNRCANDVMSYVTMTTDGVARGFAVKKWPERRQATVGVDNDLYVTLHAPLYIKEDYSASTCGPSHCSLASGVFAAWPRQRTFAAVSIHIALRREHCVIFVRTFLLQLSLIHI